MEADDIALLEELVLRSDGLHASSLDDLCGAIGIISQHLHVETLSDASHIATYIAKGENAKTLVLQLGTAGAVEEVTLGIDKKTEYKFSYAVGVLTWGVHGHYFVSRSGFEVDVVIPCAGTDDNLQLLGSVKHLCIDFIGTDDQCVSIFHCV